MFVDSRGKAVNTTKEADIDIIKEITFDCIKLSKTLSQVVGTFYKIRHFCPLSVLYILVFLTPICHTAL